MRWISASVLAFLLAPPAPLLGQEPGPSLGVVATYSNASSSPLTDPIRLSTIEIEVVHPLVARSSWGLEHAVALPLVFVANNPTGTVESFGERWIVWNPPPPSPTAGLGLRPVGLRGWIGGRRLRVQADASGGFLWFSKPLLAANATRFNFTAAAGVGLRVEVPGRGYAVVGYRVHHTSNGGLGDVNPGIDSHQLYVGVWLR